MCAKIPIDRLDVNEIQKNVLTSHPFLRTCMYVVGSDFEAKTVQCLHFEHVSSFDYSVINVVH